MVAPARPRVRPACGPGDFLFKPAGAPHDNDFAAGHARSLRVELSPVVAEVHGCGPLQVQAPELALLGYRVLQEYRVKDDAALLSLEELLLQTLESLAGHSPRLPARAPSLAYRAASYLREHATESIELRSVALELGVHRSHLSRSFRDHYRCTMGQYLRRCRVERVARALERSREPLAAIAAAAGFTDQSHCTRVFRAQMGITPAQFRRIVAAPRSRPR